MMISKQNQRNQDEEIHACVCVCLHSRHGSKEHFGTTRRNFSSQNRQPTPANNNNKLSKKSAGERFCAFACVLSVSSSSFAFLTMALFYFCPSHEIETDGTSISSLSFPPFLHFHQTTQQLTYIMIIQSFSFSHHFTPSHTFPPYIYIYTYTALFSIK
jgi:hypothetical protein